MTALGPHGGKDEKVERFGDNEHYYAILIIQFYFSLNFLFFMFQSPCIFSSFSSFSCSNLFVFFVNFVFSVFQFSSISNSRRPLEPAWVGGRIHARKSDVAALLLTNKGVWMMATKSADEPPDPTGANALGEMITLEVPSEKQAFGEVTLIVDGLLEQTNLTERQIKDVRQAVMEMVTNAMEWGHRFDPSLSIRIDFRADTEAVTFRVRDQGAGFEHYQNGRTFPSVEELVEQGRDRIKMLNGFGILLARGLVDEFFYNDRGNEVTLIKRVGGVISKA